MPSIIAPEITLAVSAATSGGLLTVSSTTNLIAGSSCWVTKNDGSASVLVKILNIVNSTTFNVRIFNNNSPNSNPQYAGIDMTAFNGTSQIYQMPQAVPVEINFTNLVSH